MWFSRFCFVLSIIHPPFTVCSILTWIVQFMRKQRIKFSPNDNPLLSSPEKTNGAPRWCFNITNYLGVPGKGTDVGPRMRKGWGAGQGHHTPRLGSDKHCWLGGLHMPTGHKREAWTEPQELQIGCYSAEGQRGCWRQGHWGSEQSYAQVLIYFRCYWLLRAVFVDRLE